MQRKPLTHIPENYRGLGLISPSRFRDRTAATEKFYALTVGISDHLVVYCFDRNSRRIAQCWSLPCIPALAWHIMSFILPNYCIN